MGFFVSVVMRRAVQLDEYDFPLAVRHRALIRTQIRVQRITILFVMHCSYSQRDDWLRRRANTTRPNMPVPIRTQVEGSGTTPGFGGCTTPLRTFQT